MAGIGVVINPNAGGNRRKKGRRERFEKIVGEDGVVRETINLSEVGAVAEEFARRGIDVLAVCGGDGSYFRTLSALVPLYDADKLPLFLPLRAGTINYIARSIGCIRGGPEQVLAHVVKSYRHGRAHDVTERDLLVVNGEHFGFVAGVGIIVNFLRLYYSQPHPSSRTAVRLLVRLALAAMVGSPIIRALFRRVEADIDCDGERVPHRLFSVILAGTVTHIALGFRPLYLANRKRGYFHLLAGPIGPLRIMRRLGRFYRGLPVDDPELYDNLAQEAIVRFARPTHFMIDGDLVMPQVTTLRLGVGPRITMIRG